MPTVLRSGGIGGGALSNGAVIRTTQAAADVASAAANRNTVQPADVPVPYFAISAISNTLVQHQGGGTHRVTKYTGSSFDENAVSAGITGDFVLHMRTAPNAFNGWIGGGLNDTQLAAPGRNDINYLFQFSQGGFDSWLIFENGVQITGSVIPGSDAWIWRIGTDLYYGRGSTFGTAQANIERTVSGVSAALYFNSAAETPGLEFDATLSLPQDLVGVSSLTFAASATATGKGALTGSAALTFAPSGTATGSGALTGASTLTFSPSSTLTGKGALTGASTIVFSPSSTLTGKGALSGTGALTFASSGTLAGTGTLSGASTLVFAASGTATGAGALSGSSALSFTSSGSITGVGALSGSSALTLNASGTLTSASIVGSLVGTASITFAAAGSLNGIAYITGLASLNFDASGTLTGIDIRDSARATRRLRHSKHDYPDKWGVWR